jgi:hypothetical protein
MSDNAKTNARSFKGLSPQERRRDPRYPFTSAVEVVARDTQTRIQGRTSDLSRGGCFLDTASCFPAGSIVTVRLIKDNRRFEADAEVVYSLVGMGMGVKFTAAGAEQLGAVEKWVAELSGEALPAPETEIELDQPSEQPHAQETAGDEEHLVLSELVMELMKQGILSNVKCQAMLQKLNVAARADDQLCR